MRLEPMYACSVVDCPNPADACGGWCLKHLTPRSRRNGVRVTVHTWVRGWGESRFRDTDEIVVRSTTKAGKILEIARREIDGKLAGVEIRPEIECFDANDTRFRKLR